MYRLEPWRPLAVVAGADRHAERVVDAFIRRMIQRARLIELLRGTR